MLRRKSVTATMLDGVPQEPLKVALKYTTEALVMTPHPCLEYTECELDRIIIR